MERTEALRRQHFKNQQIARYLGIPPARVSHVLCWLGFNRFASLEPAEPARRYERERLGELIDIDIKKFGRFGRTGQHITATASGRARAGDRRECLHLAVD